MANDYERITRTELHKLQNKLNKTQEDFEREIKIMQDYQNEKDKKLKQEKRENIIGGVIIVTGVLSVNFILPYFVGTKIFSTSFNPNFGPIDLLATIWGGWNIWKGLKKQ